MRPISRGPSPKHQDFKKYKDALPYLLSRLGFFCSYCERYVSAGLEVEHLQHKDPNGGFPLLAGRWENFLLSCKNCNTTKGTKTVYPSEFLLPDRDNTHIAFQYQPDGTVKVESNLDPNLARLADNTLRLVGLHKAAFEQLDKQGKRVYIDRVSQRMQAWGEAQDAHDGLMADPQNWALRQSIVKLAVKTGFFSVWMSVFANEIPMQLQFVNAFSGTRESECFDPLTAQPISPAPNPDGLPNGSKI